MSATAPGPRVFITGITGQDGFYLARLLLARGCHVTAGLRPGRELPTGLQSCAEGRGEDSTLESVPFDLMNPESISGAIAMARPDQIYHLAGKSSVSASWEEPIETFDANLRATAHMLSAARAGAPHAHFVFAGSGDCFDHLAAGTAGITPQTPLRCTSPYAISKAAAMQLVQCYREQYGMRASVAIFMNHTSPRRPLQFVERKIVHEAVRIVQGRAGKLCLGSLETRRDWSWAEDIVEGLALLGAKETTRDYVFASGSVHTTGDWVRLAFTKLGIDPGRHLELDPSELHMGDRPHTRGDIGPAASELGWTPKTGFEQMVEQMVDFELSEQDHPG